MQIDSGRWRHNPLFLHQVMLHLPATYPVDQLPSISGGGLRGRFVFSQLHFHWSSDLKRGGSEHVIYPQRYPAEMHLVHYNAKYGKMEEAVRHGDGLAVLAVFIEVSDRWGHVAFRRFVNQFDSIITEGQEVNVTQPTMLMDFLPDELGNFYRYSGSLTTPGCLEIVTWTVFDSSIAVSARQVIICCSIISFTHDTSLSQLKFSVSKVRPIDRSQRPDHG